MIVVVDTSALFALADEGDARHAAATRSLDQLVDTDLVTTNYIACETLSLVHRRLGMDQARLLQRAALQPMGLLWTTRLEHASAVEAFLASGRATSFVDCATMAVMRARGIERVFTYDDDFRRAGFDTVG